METMCLSRRVGRLSLTVALAVPLIVQASPAAFGEVFSGVRAQVSSSAPPERQERKMASGSCLLRGRPVHDFKLKDLFSGGMTTFLDTVHREYTFLYYLSTGGRGSLESLEVLQGLRDRYRDRVGLVAIFLDPADSGEMRRFLSAHRLNPDYALHDPAHHQARCYAISSPPALHVVGPSGEIIFTVSSSRPVDLAAFTARLDHVLAMQQTGRNSLAEAQVVYRDAMEWLGEGRRRMALFYLRRVLELQPNLYTVNCQMADIYRDMRMKKEAARYYSRYISADLYAYDLVKVRESLRALTGMKAHGLPAD